MQRSRFDHLEYQLTYMFLPSHFRSELDTSLGPESLIRLCSWEHLSFSISVGPLRSLLTPRFSCPETHFTHQFRDLDLRLLELRLCDSLKLKCFLKWLLEAPSLRMLRISGLWLSALKFW